MLFFHDFIVYDFFLLHDWFLPPQYPIAGIYIRYEMMMLFNPFCPESSSSASAATPQSSLFVVAQKILSCQYSPIDSLYSEQVSMI
jgi:hypothetical protein